MPPHTEAIVVISANRQAEFGLANTIGASITSGGIGKKDDSAKLNPAKYQGALRCFAHNKTRS